MKRVHDKVELARAELVANGYHELLPAKNGARRWARKDALRDVRVIRREERGADEAWVIESEGGS
jgi:hypothetical protein